MSMTQFIGSVESAKLLEERDKRLVFGDHCTRKWNGQINKLGDSVEIEGIKSPTIYTLQIDKTYAADGVGAGSVAGSGKSIIHRGIPTAEDLDGFSVKLPVNQSHLWNFQVGDYDQQVSDRKDVLEKARQKQAAALADRQDQWIARVMYSVEESRHLDSGSPWTLSKSNILDIIDEVVMKLRLHDVPDSEKIYAEVSPQFLRVLKIALRGIDTNNSKIVRGREVTTYNGVDFTMTNNAIVKVDDDNTPLGAGYEINTAFFHTMDAVAFFDPLIHNEGYRPEKGFADAIKGFNYYDAGVVVPSELITVPCSSFSYT